MRPPGGWSSRPRACSAFCAPVGAGTPSSCASHARGGPSAVNPAPQRRRVARSVARSQLRGWGEAGDQSQGRRDAGRAGPASDWSSVASRHVGAGPRGRGLGRPLQAAGRAAGGTGGLGGCGAGGAGEWARGASVLGAQVRGRGWSALRSAWSPAPRADGGGPPELFLQLLR